MRSAGEPMVMALEGPERRARRGSRFRRGRFQFPLRVGFPLFVSNVVHWLAGRRSRSEAMLKAGGTFFPKDGEKIRKDPLRAKQAARETEPAPSSQTPFKLRKNGFYEVRGPAGSRWLAVNTADAAESDLRAAGSANRSCLLLVAGELCSHGAGCSGGPGPPGHRMVPSPSPRNGIRKGSCQRTHQNGRLREQCAGSSKLWDEDDLAARIGRHHRAVRLSGGGQRQLFSDDGLDAACRRAVRPEICR